MSTATTTTTTTTNVYITSRRPGEQVWARLEEGGDRGAFQRLWEALQLDVLRQNRRWRREMTREAAAAAGSEGGK